MFYSPNTVAIPHNKLVQYYCGAERYVHVQPDGSLIIGTEVPLNLPKARASGVFRPPLTIVKMCMWIGGDYKIFGVVTHRFTTPIFQWPVEPGVNQWSEGAIVSDDDGGKWIPKGSKLELPPGALRCT